MKESAASDVKRSRAKLRGGALLLAVLLAIGLAGAFRLDAPVRAWQLAKGERPLRAVAAALSRYGDWPPLAGAIVGTALVARARRSRRVVMGCVILLTASILAGAIVNPLRAATGRARPSKKIEAGWYFARHEGRWLVGQHAYSSFPSAHTTIAFAFAAALFVAGPAAGATGILIAASIGWSRLYLGVHHPSDVMAGAILGSTCGWVILRSARVRWWTWRAASAACGSRSRWPRSCAVPWLRSARVSA